MRTWVKGTSRAVALTASFVALGATAIPANAFADVTNGDGGVLSGNQINLPVSAPVDASGNGVAAGGTANATSQGGSSVTGSGGGGGQRTSGENGIASGNQVNAPISAPVNACGNAVAVLGAANAGCVEGSRVNGSGDGGQVTSGVNGVAAGNQVNAPISAPVNICGNAVAVAGAAAAGCEGGAKVKNGGLTGAGQTTSGVSSIDGGTQLNAPISVPVDVCGNAVGNALAGCEGGASVRNGGHGSGNQTTNGDLSVIGGHQANLPISAPATVCGDAGAVLGEAGAFCEGGAHVRSSSGGDQQTSGVAGVVAGHQGNAPISVPVEVCGDAAAVVGAAAATCTGQTLVAGPHGPGGQSSGQSSVIGGNQGNGTATAPIDVCGDAATLIGHAEPQCTGGHGGYHPYNRVAGTSGPATVVSEPRPVTEGEPLPVSPGAALPVLPRLPSPGEVGAPGALTEVPRANNVPFLYSLPGAEALARTDALRKADSRPQTAAFPAPPTPNTNGLPKAKGLPKVNALPKGKGLPKPGSLAEAGGMPGMRYMSGAREPHFLDGGPGEEIVSGAKSLLDDRTRRGATAATPLPGTRLPEAGALRTSPTTGAPLGIDLFDLTDVPGAPRVENTVPSKPLDLGAVTGAVRVPGVADGAALPGKPVVPARTEGGPAAGGSVLGVPKADGTKVPGLSDLPVTADVHAPETDHQIGPMRPVAAEKPITADAATGSIWVLGAAGLLAAVSGALALTRRIRLGGRR